MSHLDLRPATPGDQEFAYRVKEASFRPYVELLWTWDEVEQRRLQGRRLQEHDFRVVRLDGIECGILALETEPDALHLHQLFILPEHQGKGIGQRCMNLLMDEARRHRLPMRLQVLKVNPRARRFYERLGFEKVGETSSHDVLECGRPSRDSAG